MARKPTFLVSTRGSRGETLYFKSANFSMCRLNWVDTVDAARKISTLPKAFKVYDYLMKIGTKVSTRIHQIINR